jgi:hypothetical protein
MTTLRYAHTLLFDCPQCKLPIAIGLISEQGNLEDIDAKAVHIQCRNCETSAQVVAATAQRHYVDEWPFKETPT